MFKIYISPEGHGQFALVVFYYSIALCFLTPPPPPASLLSQMPCWLQLGLVEVSTASTQQQPLLPLAQKSHGPRRDAHHGILECNSVSELTPQSEAWQLF